MADGGFTDGEFFYAEIPLKIKQVTIRKESYTESIRHSSSANPPLAFNHSLPYQYQKQNPRNNSIPTKPPKPMFL